MKKTVLSGAAVVAIGLLGGCALLKTPDPVQTYRFGGDVTAVNTAPAATPVQVQLRRIEFPQAARGDKMLGITGTEAAYIMGARWVTPAEQLYADSLTNAFVSQSTRVRLIGRRELTPVTRLLDVDVQAFEARYAAAGSAPTVVVSVRARLLTFPERTVVSEQTFTVSQPATANRAGDIVQAFDIASRDVNTQVVAWTDASVGAR